MVVRPTKAGIERIGAYMVDEVADDLPPTRLLLNSNESAFGPSPMAIEAARQAASQMERYFEGADDALAPRIASFFKLDASRIVVGGGSDDLLSRIARIYLGPGDELLRSVNGYPKVPNYAYANDAEVCSVADEDLRPSIASLVAGINVRTKVVYLANPENPAGTFLNGAEVRELHAAMPDDVLLVLDCAYEEYVDDPRHEPATALVEAADNVVMSRTFSKIFGLAGARVGWIYGSPDIVANVRRVATTFPVADASIAAAMAALEDRAYFERVFAANQKGRRMLSEQLGALGLRIIPSQANFVLVGFPDRERSALQADLHLRRRGIAVRRFGSPVYRDYLRITIGQPDDMAEVVVALRDFLSINDPDCT